MIKQASVLLLVILFVILQVSIIPAIISFPAGINILIIAVLYFLITFKTREYFIWTIVLGLMADIYTGLPPGVITLSLLITALIAYEMYLNYFSHRSSVTLILFVIMMCIIYEVLLYGLSFVWVIINPEIDHTSILTMTVVQHTIGTTITSILCYIIFRSMLKRFRDRFLIHHT